jgi:hypothetical protein
MATYASDTGGGSDFDPVPEGSHPAICDMFVDFGLQETKGKYAGKIQHKIYLRWQIPSLRLSYEKDGEKIEGPMTIGSTYTLSLHEKAALRKLLQQWRGRAFTADELKKFDVTTVVGVPCLISVSHAPKEGGGVYANVDTAMKLPNGMEPPALEGEKVIYDADNLHTYEQLRPWMQDKLKEQKSSQDADKANDPDAWREKVDANGNHDDLDDDIPF